MCGGYNTPGSFKQLKDVLDVDWDPAWAQFNLAPYDCVPIVRAAAPGYEVAQVQWWLVPPWAKGGKMDYPTFNARGETVFEKPSFRAAARRQRCLIPAAGFFERPKAGGRDRPRYLVRFRDQRPFCMAGLWERWEGDGRALESTTVITTGANPLMDAIGHPRSPVVLPPDAWALWLDPETEDRHTLQPLLARPWPAGDLEAIPVRNSGLRERVTDPAVFVTPEGFPLRIDA